MLPAWLGSDSALQEAVDALVEEGYDPVYGARPLKRVIQKVTRLSPNSAPNAGQGLASIQVWISSMFIISFLAVVLG